jgi:hypothetical protein
MALLPVGAGAAAALLTAAVAVGAPSAAGSAPSSSFSVEIDGRPLGNVDTHNPLVLTASKEAMVRIRVENSDPRPLTVRSVVLSGKVLGLTFFTFTTRVDLDVESGGTSEVEFPLDLADLAGQAVGLIPSRLAVVDDRRQVVGSAAFPADVRAPLWSAYGAFGIATAGITGLLLIAAFARLATHSLPSSRFSRALRFGAPGLGLGLTLMFLLSILRVLPPYTALGLPVIAVSGGVGVVTGYLSPAPWEPEEEELGVEEVSLLLSGEDSRRGPVGPGEP